MKFISISPIVFGFPHIPLGNGITNIINKRLSAGEQHIEFDASHLPSGVYYYRLQIGRYIETQPLVVAD